MECVDTRTRGKVAPRKNIARQAAIGAKEGTAAGISRHVGTDVTDSVLREA